MEAAAHGDEHVPAAPRRRPLRGRLLPGSSDERLVARIRAGDERAFELLFDRYHRGLLGFARHMLGSREEAEDAVQHTLLQAYRSLRGTDGEVRLKPWLYTIARNRCLSVLRARRDEVALDDAPPSVDGLAAAVERREDLRAMLADIHRLPDEQREALVLFELGDLPQDEIAEVLGVRRDKVKALVFQARESLLTARTARETPCAAIREQLSTLRGAALRRGPLRRHVEQCAGCQQFEAEVRRQRAAMAVLLPVVPSLAFKGSVLGALAGGHAGAGAAGLATASSAGTGAAATTTAGTAATGLAAKGILAKALVALAVAGTAGGGGYVAVHEISKPATHRSHTAAPVAKPGAPGAPGGTTTPSGIVTPGHPATPAHGHGVRAHGPGHGLATGHARHHGKGRALGHAGRPAAGGHGASGTVHAHALPVARRPAHRLVAKMRARRRAHAAPRRAHPRHPAAPVRPTHTSAPTAKAPPKSGDSAPSGTTTTTTTTTTPTTTTTAPTTTTTAPTSTTSRSGRAGLAVAPSTQATGN